jgi:hypothetical protein
VRILNHRVSAITILNYYLLSYSGKKSAHTKGVFATFAIQKHLIKYMISFQKLGIPNREE